MTVAELHQQLAALLVEIEAGRVEASPTFRARIEGAVVALAVVLGDPADALLARLGSPVSDPP